MFSIWWLLAALAVGFYFGVGALAMILVASRDTPETQAAFGRSSLENNTVM